MKRIMDTSETLGVVKTPEGPREVCATADARFDEAAKRLVVSLDAYLRNVDLVAKEKRFATAWLPKPQRIEEPAGPDESADLARDIFHRWVRRVRDAAPALHRA